MPGSEVHQCKCPHCQQETPHPDQELHRQMNLLLSQLDEQQRRWYVAVEFNRMGAGGDRVLAQITGLDEKTIQRGRQELTGERIASDRSSASACPEEIGHAPKKRPSARGDSGSLGAARNSG